MTTTTRAQASPPRASATTKPLGFEERLALAALEVDARINTTPFNLADVIRRPVEAPQLPRTTTPNPYCTPVAATLHRARVRLETDGWCRDNLYDEAGAVCPIRAIRIEAASRREADDACVLLLEVIQRDFADAATIPSWNAQQTSAAPVLLYFDRGAEHAHSRSL